MNNERRTMTDEKVDAGLADAEKAAAEAAEMGKAAAEFPVEDSVPLVESVETLLFHSHIDPAPKVLLLALVWIGQPMTAPQLAKSSGLTKVQVFHALKRFVTLEIVTETMVPDVKNLRFDRHYEITPEARGRFGKIGPVEKDKAPKAKAKAAKAGDSAS
jgi:hypothetical protein